MQQTATAAKHCPERSQNDKEAAKHSVCLSMMMTSPCSLNCSMTFLQSWQNGWRQIMKMRYGDHVPISGPWLRPWWCNYKI